MHVPGDHHDVVEAVAAECHVSVEAIYAQNRLKSVVYARHLCSLILRDDRGLSYPEIARELARSDHTTSIHSYARGRELKLTDARTQERLWKIYRRLRRELTHGELAGAATDSLNEQMVWLAGTEQG